MTNFLVIGVGPHARRSHLPALAAGQAAGLVGTVCGVDLVGVADAIVPYQADDGPRSLPVTLVERFDADCRTLPEPVRRTLDTVVEQRRIGAVVVSTEPSHHLVYVRWALERGLSVLLDKPLSVQPGVSTDPARAGAVLDDADALLNLYAAARERYPRLMVSVQCQRRYHPAFTRMRQLIAEVAHATNCPVTSIQSFHSDGQWRLPDELADLSYHGYDRGYGKCAHSGYHFFDLVPWLVEAGERPGKELDSVSVHARITRPADTLAQLGVADHERLLPGFAARNPYTQQQLEAATSTFGEVDAFLSLAFTSHGRTMTLGSINLVHNGYSRRAHLTPAGSLYTGNGRVRQETHIIQQGPFQALHFHSFQALDHTSADGQGHVEVHVLRNHRVRQGWQPYTRLDHQALTTSAGSSGITAPTQPSARRRAVEEFLDYLGGRLARDQMASELTTHRRAATLMAGSYLSMARQWNGSPQPAVLDFRTIPAPAPRPAGALR
ncbi:Gfo/Idh/MocA family protein [Streptomyces sp. NPDC056716]|uniref:Gfo/Idh/MocA family protein n=1 Tax=unclassified Streptomyces TaxID=2593676 RepID=UPI00367666E5